jgi:hypothetical protein
MPVHCTNPKPGPHLLPTKVTSELAVLEHVTAWFKLSRKFDSREGGMQPVASPSGQTAVGKPGAVVGVNPHPPRYARFQGSDSFALRYRRQPGTSCDVVVLSA